MYNGIGLGTARGSGTNGYVQKNRGFVRAEIVRAKTTSRSDREHEKLRSRTHDKRILDHELKRKVRVRVLELREIMESKGYVKRQ